MSHEPDSILTGVWSVGTLVESGSFLKLLAFAKYHSQSKQILHGVALRGGASGGPAGSIGNYCTHEGRVGEVAAERPNALGQIFEVRQILAAGRREHAGGVIILG